MKYALDCFSGLCISPGENDAFVPSIVLSQEGVPESLVLFLLIADQTQLDQTISFLAEWKSLSGDVAIMFGEGKEHPELTLLLKCELGISRIAKIMPPGNAPSLGPLREMRLSHDVSLYAVAPLRRDVLPVVENLLTPEKQFSLNVLGVNGASGNGAWGTTLSVSSVT